MSRTYPSQALLPVALLFLLATATAQLVNPGTRPATITKDSNWMTLKKCVNQCIWDQGSNDTPDIGGDLADHLSCGSPYVNGCYCNPQSATLAHSFITMCANYLCNSYYKSPPAQTDIESGTAVYASYCTSAMGAAYTPESISQAPLPNTGAPASGPTASLPKQTGPGPSNPAATSDANSKGNPNQQNATDNGKSDKKIGGLSQGAFIGVVVSCACSVIGLLFGIGFKIYKHKKNTKLQAERAQQLEYQYQAKA